MTDRSDKKLLEDFFAGDKEAFDQIVKRYSTNVYRLAWKFTRDQKTAEDITQETFLRCYEYFLKNPKEVTLKPWLMTICVNQCRNLHKKKKSFNFSSLKKEDTDQNWEERIPDKEKSPNEELKQKNEAERVNAAIEQLPDKYQIVIQMRYTEDLSYKEIAEVLNLPINTVKVHLNRAKEKLKVYLND